MKKSPRNKNRKTGRPTPGSSRFLLISGIFAMLVFSCAARINGKLDRGSAGDFTAAISLQPQMSALIRSFQAFAGEKGTQLLDGQAISNSMTKAPGIAQVSFRNTSETSIEGPVKISKIGEFLTSGGAEGFIRFEQPSAGAGRCTINLRRDLGPEILSRISVEVSAYLEALMAPLATGEELSNAEYLKLVESMYGKGIADEISASTIRVSVDFPGQVQSVQGGTFSGSRAEFQIPLLDLLVLEKPLVYEVTWK
jgi:hypothetical protein